MKGWLLIFVGGGCGSLLRYSIAGWVQRWTAGSFPAGTLTVNLVGCLAIGFLASLFTGPVLIREEYRLAMLVGVLGGFTTFSSFSWETVSLANDGQWWFAAANILLSNACGLFAAWLGARAALAMYGP
jgi:CrcB protein